MAATTQVNGDKRPLIDRLAAYDAETLAGFEAIADRIDAANAAPRSSDYLRSLPLIAASDVRGLVNAEKSYGISWKLRGGVDTFHMLLRKWERIEKRAATRADGAEPYDVFEHIRTDPHEHGLLDDVRDLRRYLMLGEAEIRARAATGDADSDRGFLAQLQPIADGDVSTIEQKERTYGDSWRRNGGIGAFMIFARKWDRIKQRVTTALPNAARDNILEHIAADTRAEPILDDIRDLRQFLLLVEAEMAARGVVQVGTARDDREA